MWKNVFKVRTNFGIIKTDREIRKEKYKRASKINIEIFSKIYKTLNKLILLTQKKKLEGDKYNILNKKCIKDK